MQVTRFAAPLAFNFLHVVRMQEGLPNGQVSSDWQYLYEYALHMPAYRLAASAVLASCLCSCVKLAALHVPQRTLAARDLLQRAKPAS